MNKIKILPPEEAKKIAAGEVVERPASVVKETIENSIDAGATQISLYIEKAGKQLIRIVDNGSGMSQDDARLCFSTHATSKIESLHDLEQIQSFGFRGEALATISAVSKITLITKTKDKKNLGIKLKYSDGKFETEENIACSNGTDLQIQDIFYNTPVRKKFLKQDETEFNQIQSIFHAFCLSTLDIHFKLYRDGRLILNAPVVKNVKERTSQIWGHNFAQNLIELTLRQAQGERGTSQPFVLVPSNVEGSKDTNASITGIISNHNFWRYGRQQIFFFVNNRAVKNTELSKALLKGYLNVLPPQRFPAAFIFITLDNSLVDINVHPRKEEVKFAKPLKIQNTLQKLVTQTLENNLSKQLQNDVRMVRQAHHERLNTSFKNLEQTEENNTLSVRPDPEPDEWVKGYERDFKNLQYPGHNSLPVRGEPVEPNEQLINNNLHQNLEQTTKNNPISVRGEPVEPNEHPLKKIIHENKNLDTSEHIKIIGQLFNTYILIENKNGFLMIDQHAAHERILYEKFLKNFEKKEGTRLLFPELITLQPTQLKTILKEKDFFSSQGIEIEQFGENQLAIKTSPPKIQNQSLKELIFEAIEFIEENEQLEVEVFRKKLNEHMHTQMACKLAIKAGDLLTQTQMHQIIDDLQKTDNRFICAHGRPSTWSLSKYEIEKNFKRK